MCKPTLNKVSYISCILLIAQTVLLCCCITCLLFTGQIKALCLSVFTADPGDMVHVNCRPLTPTDTEVEEIRADDNNYYTEGSRKTPTTPTLHPTLPTTSRDREITLREETREYAGGETAGEEYQVEEVLARGNGSEQMETGGNQSTWKFYYPIKTEQRVKSFVGCDITPCDTALNWSDFGMPQKYLIWGSN